MKSPYMLNDDLQIQSFTVGNEQQKIIIVDNLLQAPQSMVDFAASKNEFENYKGHCNFYPGIRVPAPADYSTALTPAIYSILIKEYEGIGLDWKMNKAECSLSLITVNPEDLRSVQSTPHFDSANTHHLTCYAWLFSRDLQFVCINFYPNPSTTPPMRQRCLRANTTQRGQRCQQIYKALQARVTLKKKRVFFEISLRNQGIEVFWCQEEEKIFFRAKHKIITKIHT